jgi:hypothetical protein
MRITEEKLKQIEEIFRSFLQNRVKTIKRLTLRDLDINPFLLRVLSKELELDNSRAIVKWLISQRIERGTVTSFGIALQEAARIFSEGTAVEGADILRTKGGRRYYIQIKSGPNTIPKDLGVRIAQLLRSAQRRNRGSVALYGMCYGSKEQVSNIVRKYVQEEGGVDWLSGREFWEFISDEPRCIEIVYEIAERVGATFKDPAGKTLSEIINEKIEDLTKEFEQTYGKSGEEMWRNLLEKNS